MQPLTVFTKIKASLVEWGCGYCSLKDSGPLNFHRNWSSAMVDLIRTSKEGVLKDILKEFSYDGPDNGHLQNLSRLVGGFVLHVDGSSMCRRLPWCNQLGILADFIALEVWFFVQRKFGTCKVANLIIFKRWKWGLLIYSSADRRVPQLISQLVRTWLCDLEYVSSSLLCSTTKVSGLVGSGWLDF